jgi:hypothetical protein
MSQIDCRFAVPAKAAALVARYRGDSPGAGIDSTDTLIVCVRDLDASGSI